jgi:transcriptional regulator with XRE-family HTH domain
VEPNAFLDPHGSASATRGRASQTPRGAGLTIEQVAERLECSISKVSRIETAQVRPTPRDVRDMLAIYEVDGDTHQALLQIAREARQRGWWEAYTETCQPSSPAWRRRRIHPLVLAGTRPWATAVCGVRPSGSPSDPHRPRAGGYPASNRTSHGPPAAPHGWDSLALWAVLDEAVLRRPMGTPNVMRQQLKHLTEVMTLQNVTLQVLPFGLGAHPGLDGQFSIIGFPEPAEADIVYLENAMSDVYIEDAEALSRYTSIFDRLCAMALSPADSEAFLARVVEAH